MSLIKNTIPENIESEKEKFFASNDYNPQFIYSNPIDLSLLSIYGQPKKYLFDFALAMMQKKKTSNVNESAPLSKTEIFEEIDKIINLLGIKPLEIVFTHKRLSSISLGNQKIFIREPIAFSKKSLCDSLNHEIQTHYLRRINNQHQPWSSQAGRDKNFRSTEEGLANLHTHLFKQDKFLYRTYLHYVACYLSASLSFRETYNQLVKLGTNAELAWEITLRKKRGLTDTSQPGGLTKDIVYLEGAIEVWKWLKAGNDPKKLYIGKVGLNEVEDLYKIANTEDLIYPTFFANLDEYLTLINQIGNVNQFNEI